MKKLTFILALAITITGFSSCEEDEPIEKDNQNYEIKIPVNPQDKGDRLFGINISENQNGFMSSYEKAKEANIQVLELNIQWNDIETSEGNYTDPGGNIAATAFYGSENIQVGFSIAIINTVAWELPDYLKNVDITSTQFITAFTNMLDWFMTQIPDNVTVPYISIGNEIDLVLDGDTEWNNYTIFYREVASYIHTNYPDLMVGVKNTVMNGLYKSELSKIQAINEFSDIIMLNYYPQDDSYKVLAPNSVASHFNDFVNYFPNKDIWMTEVGYQSGSNYCASSKTKQAEFYHELFTAWDTHKDRIKFVLIDWLHDQSQSTIDDWKNYYGDDPALVEYLSTLGICNHDGTEKFAFGQIQEELEARAW
jgi:hypothetical protein